MLTALPMLTPLSTRTALPLGSAYRVIMPVEGINSLEGSSAQIRASIAHPLKLDILLAKGNLSPSAIRQLKFHQIQAGNHFGDRMLHLKAGIHFKKIKIAVRIHYKLHCPGIDITGFERQVARGFSHATSHLRS
jgi:hypothetical protein